MSANKEDPELEELKKQRLLQLQQMQQEALRREKMQQEVESQRQAILRTILTPEARERLTAIKLARPEYATALEDQLIRLAQTRQLPNKITDEQLKKLLQQLIGRRSEGRIIDKRRK